MKHNANQLFNPAKLMANQLGWYKLLCYSLVLAFCGLTNVFPVFAQKYASRIDSLKALLKEVKQDTIRVMILNELAYESIFNSYEDAIKYTNQALKISENIGYKIGEAQTFNIMGIIYRFQGNYAKAVDLHLKALKISEQKGYKQGIANNYSNLGIVYYEQENYKTAVEYYEKAIKIKEELNDKRGISYSLNDIANVYLKEKNYGKALEYNLKALKTNEERQDTMGIATILKNIGIVYQSVRNYVKSEEYLLKSIKIAERKKDKFVLVEALDALGYNYRMTNRLDEAQKVLLRCIEIAKSIDLKRVLRSATKTLSEVYALKAEFAKAYKYQTLHIAYKDSTIDQEVSKKIMTMQAAYQLEKQQNEARLALEREKQLQAEKEARQWRYIYASIALVLVVLIILGLVIRSNRLQQRANQLLKKQKEEIEAKSLVLMQQKEEIENKNIELEQQKEEILAQRDAIEEKSKELEMALTLIEKTNRRIHDSIRYAKNIQQAILPYSTEIDRFFPQHFVIYKPRDIVSGDFYWYKEINQQPQKAILAVVDCTGHGVPGAFMSMIGNVLLNEIINEQKIYNPAKILETLHFKVVTELKQAESNNNDGMDLAMTLLEKQPDSTWLLTFAGAKRPLYCIKDNELIEMKGNRSSIGGIRKEAQRVFENKQIILKPGDSFYLTTDGLCDNPSPQRERFGEKRLKAFLLENHQKDVAEQQRILSKMIADHQQYEEQRDDITLIGIKIT
ncbi:MAG: tetratricopeptide repeat protein [Microscillaceae bacterium]|nr:tetratricopeptide repeat protein [Microscillaceae bacterium]MDW8461810.1 tetratricopeptide repeat protein [Cytophagales bacterium]